jgi:hypothetical protein
MIFLFISPAHTLRRIRVSRNKIFFIQTSRFILFSWLITEKEKKIEIVFYTKSHFCQESINEVFFPIFFQVNQINQCIARKHQKYYIPSNDIKRSEIQIYLLSSLSLCWIEERYASGYSF